MAGTASETRRIAVLTSGHGRGSNLRAMHAWFKQHQPSVEIAFVTASSQSSPVSEFCAGAGLPCHVLNPCHIEEFEAKVETLCKGEEVALIALAGFMKRLSAGFLERISIPVLNIHPALLPKFGGKGMYGSKVHEAVWSAGEKQSGATVHRVDELYDHGSVVAQEKVDISQCSGPEEIAALVLQAEHRIYAPAILKVLAGVCS